MLTVTWKDSLEEWFENALHDHPYLEIDFDTEDGIVKVYDDKG